MTTDVPLVNAALARLPHPREALAALVVAFSLALVYEAPHVAMTEAATALVTTRTALARLRAFYVRLALALLLGATLIVATPLYAVLVERLMGIPPAVAHAARPALAVFLLWPVPIGWRRLHQGALIRHGHSRAVGNGALVRVVVLAVSLPVILAAGWPAGAAGGALAMTLSVTAEAMYADRAARRLLRDLPDETGPSGQAHLGDIFWPLAGTTALGTLARPILGAGIAQAAGAAQATALAAWGLGWGLTQMIGGATLLFSQVSITWDRDQRPGLRRRGAFLLLALGLLLSALVGLLAWTPLAGWTLRHAYAASPALTAAVLPVLRWLVPAPMLLTLSAFGRGRLIARGAARMVRAAQAADLVALASVLALGLHAPGGHSAGAALGAQAVFVMLLCDVCLLSGFTWKMHSAARQAHSAA